VPLKCRALQLSYPTGCSASSFLSCTSVLLTAPGVSEAECTPRKLAITYAYLSTHIEDESSRQRQTDTINTTPSLPFQLIMYRTGRQHSRSTSNISTADMMQCRDLFRLLIVSSGDTGKERRLVRVVDQPVLQWESLLSMNGLSSVLRAFRTSILTRTRTLTPGGNAIDTGEAESQGFLASGPRNYRCGRNQSVFEYDANREG